MASVIWIPAFAGMTGERAGMTGLESETDRREIGNDRMGIEGENPKCADDSR